MTACSIVRAGSRQSFSGPGSDESALILCEGAAHLEDHSSSGRRCIDALSKRSALSIGKLVEHLSTCTDSLDNHASEA